MKGLSLWKISASISPQAEDAAVQLLERIIGQPACVYVNARTNVTTASVYASDWSAANRAALRSGFQQLRECGIMAGPVRIWAAKIPRENWAESWKRHFKPIEIGKALLLKPSWSKRAPKPNQRIVVLDPGLSFGTGQHPTTRFCLEQIVTVHKNGNAGSFLDIGTGSGILAIAAAKLGYRLVAGMDSDVESIRIARANLKQNRVARKVKLLHQDLTRLPLRGGQKYDLVCANLIFDLLLTEKARILGRLERGGVLVLAGILRSQFPQIQAAYEREGFKVTCFRAKREWASGTFVRV